MTSTIRFYSFKDLPWTRKQPSLAIVMIALLGAAVWRWSEEVLLLIAATYTATGVTLHIVRLLRHRLVFSNRVIACRLNGNPLES